MTNRQMDQLPSKKERAISIPFSLIRSRSILFLFSGAVKEDENSSSYSGCDVPVMRNFFSLSTKTNNGEAIKRYDRNYLLPLPFSILVTRGTKKKVFVSMFGCTTTVLFSYSFFVPLSLKKKKMSFYYH